MHVHLEVDGHGHGSLPAALTEASAKYFKAEDRTPSLDRIADVYRELNMAAVVFTVDARTQLKHEPNSIDELIAGAARNNDVLIPFGSVDPRTGADAIQGAKHQAIDLGARGFKFHPSPAGLRPLQRTVLPALGNPAGTGPARHLPHRPERHGRRTSRRVRHQTGYSNPLLLDAVAADFPELQIIMAHPSVPWQDEANSIATHKSNVFIDLSGWSPKYFPESLVKMSNSVLQDKVLFGTDFPLITPQKWLGAFADLPLKDEVRPKILKDNAVRLLGLGG